MDDTVKSLIQIVFDKSDMSFELKADERLQDDEIIELLEEALENMKMRSKKQIGEYLN